MNITAEAVKQLRERTGAGMMECKKALVETKGDLDAAAELMRKQGLAKADKKATRVAAEGVVVDRQVRRRPRGGHGGDQLRDRLRRPRAGLPRLRARRGRERARRASPPILAALTEAELPSGESIEERRRALVAKIGENISVRRFAVLERRRTTSAPTCTARASVRWSRSRAVRRASRTIWRCTSPRATRATSAPAQVPAEVVAKERAILTEQAPNEGKPPEIVAKMVEGRLRKSLGEITLAGQAVREGSRT